MTPGLCSNRFHTQTASCTPPSTNKKPETAETSEAIDFTHRPSKRGENIGLCQLSVNGAKAYAPKSAGSPAPCGQRWFAHLPSLDTSINGDHHSSNGRLWATKSQMPGFAMRHKLHRHKWPGRRRAPRRRLRPGRKKPWAANPRLDKSYGGQAAYILQGEQGNSLFRVWFCGWVRLVYLQYGRGIHHICSFCPTVDAQNPCPMSNRGLSTWCMDSCFPLPTLRDEESV